MLVRAFLEKNGGAVLRAGCLGPSAVQTILDDALRAGSGARLFLTLTADAQDTEVAVLEAQFSPLRDRGVRLCVTREQTPVPNLRLSA
jgi:hypothetical protein